jgi:hypothetical protein
MRELDHQIAYASFKNEQLQKFADLLGIVPCMQLR